MDKKRAKRGVYKYSYFSQSNIISVLAFLIPLIILIFAILPYKNNKVAGKIMKSNNETLGKGY
jgi:hypothetical protein